MAGRLDSPGSASSSSQVPSCPQPFQDRRLEGHAGCRRGVVGLRVGILDPSGQAEDQPVVRPEAGQAIAEVEDDAVFLGIADPGAEALEGVRRAPVVGARVSLRSRPSRSVACTGWISSLPGQDLAGRPITAGGEPFVRRDSHAGGASIDLQLQVVQIGNLVHRLSDRDLKDPVFGLELIGR